MDDLIVVRKDDLRMMIREESKAAALEAIQEYNKSNEGIEWDLFPAQLTRGEVSKILRCSVGKVDRLLNNKKITGKKIESSVLIDKESVKKYLHRQKM